MIDIVNRCLIHWSSIVPNVFAHSVETIGFKWVREMCHGKPLLQDGNFRAFQVKMVIVVNGN